MNFLKRACENHFATKQIKSCRKRLYRLAYAWCHDETLADDLVQDCLMTALQKLDQLRKAEALDAWLYSILNNKWREYLRRNRPCENIEDIHFTHDETPEYLHSLKQTIDMVKNAIEELPMGQRQVITLVDLESMSYAQVSGILDIPIGTVMSRLNRARNMLQKKITTTTQLASVTPIRSAR